MESNTDKICLKKTNKEGIYEIIHKGSINQCVEESTRK